MKTNTVGARMNEPWGAIGVPAVDYKIRRVRGGQHRFEFFWGRDCEGQCLLVLKHSAPQWRPPSRLRLAKLALAVQPSGEGESLVVLTLKEDKDRELFFRLCDDILDATDACGDGASVLAVFVQRLARWQGLLRTGGRRLSPEAQKGLIGELWFLKHWLLPAFPPAEALEFWLGPAGDPKDFAVNGVGVEVKVRKGTGHGYLHISSECQLDEGSLKALYLSVVELTSASATDGAAFTLKALVELVGDEIRSVDASSVETYEAKLLQVGYVDKEDYSELHWLVLSQGFYQVREGFPRISQSIRKTGISEVQYRVDLAECREYAIEGSVLASEFEMGRK